MVSLTPEESRVLGVLIEKATTTPEQYPLSLNALTNGSNQKSNRDPVLTLTEDQVFDAVESLREKQLAVRVDTVGSRVHKYKHLAGETLRCRAGELAVLAELLMRGPQTLGELRGRASRMSPMATLDDAKAMLRALMERQEPLAREVAPSPGSRAERFAQMLCPDLHPFEERATAPTSASSWASESQVARGFADPHAPQSDLTIRVTQLEHEIQTLRAAISKLATAVGESDPLLESLANSRIAANSTTQAD
jgi:uncharacterized protein YceH (UPF0502 family)